MTKKNVPIDLDSALERTGGDQDFLTELIDMYMEDFNPKFDELKKAITGEEFTIIQETGHYLKGSSANLSLTSLQDASLQMEIAGKEKDIIKAQQALAYIKQEFDRLKEYISSLG